MFINMIHWWTKTICEQNRADPTLRSSILVLRLAHLFCSMARFCWVWVVPGPASSPPRASSMDSPWSSRRWYWSARWVSWAWSSWRQRERDGYTNTNTQTTTDTQGERWTKDECYCVSQVGLGQWKSLKFHSWRLLSISLWERRGIYVSQYSEHLLKTLTEKLNLLIKSVYDSVKIPFCILILKTVP